MGTAEQRAAERLTAAQRVQHETAERERRYAGHLGQIRKRRDILTEREMDLRGAHKGLRAAIAMAVQDNDPPSDAAVLDAAGWTPEQLAELRAAHSIKRPGCET